MSNMIKVLSGLTVVDAEDAEDDDEDDMEDEDMMYQPGYEGLFLSISHLDL